MVLKLVEDYERPVIELDMLFKGCTALVDSGALIPVWTKSEDLLQKLGATLIKKDYPFSGFGGEATGNLYKFDLVLDDFIYPQMPIVACQNDDIPGFIIFSATMFAKMDYTIKNSTKEFIAFSFDGQKCYNLVIKGNVFVQN